MIVLIVACRATPPCGCGAMVTLRTPAAAGRFLVFALLMLLAGLPADLFLTQSWVGYIDAMHASVQCAAASSRSRTRRLGRPPYALLVENWVLTSQSLVLRGKPTDGVLAPPRDFTATLGAVPAEELPNMGRFYWRD